MRPNPTRRAAPPYDRAACRRRHRAENLSARSKEWRAVATAHVALRLGPPTICSGPAQAQEVVPRIRIHSLVLPGQLLSAAAAP